MRSTILKKLNPFHSKNNSRYNNTNSNNNKNKTKQNNSNIINNSNNDILINDESIFTDKEENFLTIEKDINDHYDINMEKIRALSNNLNNSNKLNKNKKECIFIEKDKELFKKNISPKKNNTKKEILMSNINESTSCVSNTNKKLFQKITKQNFINIQKYTNKKGKEAKKFIKLNEKNKIINSYKELNIGNEYIKNKNIKNDESSISLDEINTIKDDESDDTFSNQKLKNENKVKKKEDKVEIKANLFIKDSNTENNTNNKYKSNNLKINKKKVKLNKKSKNLNNNRNKKILEEEEKTLLYKNEDNNMKKIKIMNYFQKLINKNNENNFEETITKNKNIKNNISNNIVNSEKKITNQHIEIFHSKELPKDFIEKKEITKNMNQKNEIKKTVINKNFSINKNISNDKLIKANLISKKKLNNKIGINKYGYNEEINKNISINSVKKEFFMRNEENSLNLMSNYKMKNKEIKNNMDISLKKNQLKQLNSNKFSNSMDVNNILIINSGNNNTKEKINYIEKNIKNEFSNKVPLINKNTNSNKILNNKVSTKKNRTYFVSNSGTNILNNSIKNIHNSDEKNKKYNGIYCKKSNNNKNIQTDNCINIGVPHISNDFYINNKKLINGSRINNINIKRSISPNLNKNNNLYSKINSNILFLMNNNSKKINESKNKECKINLNNEIHKEFFKNEEKKNNLNLRYSTNINNIKANSFLNETIIDLSKSTKNKSDSLHNINNRFTFTNGNNHISPINNFKTKRIFSYFYSKDNINLNTNENIIFLNSTYDLNKKSLVIIKNKNIYKKNKIKINVDNILNTGLKYQINLINNKEKRINETQTFSNKKNINKIYKNKNTKNSSFFDIQIPLVPEENIQVISLKTMKYNLCMSANQILFLKMKKILRNKEITDIILLFLTNMDLFNLSLVNNLFLKMTRRKILEIIMNKIIYNINNNNLINNIWNIELLKYSSFNNAYNFENIYEKYINISNKYDIDIRKDLLRTFPNDSSFYKGLENYNKLFNVLKAYSNYNKEIGYAQGMNFIVAKLIIFFKNEKKSFLYLDSLFNKLQMVNVIGISNNLENKMKIMQFLLKKLCPEILQILEKNKINHEIFTASWFITLFSKNFKYDNILLTIWNFSIIFGWKFIFLFSISVVIIFKDKYHNLNLYDFTQYMKNIFIFEHFKKKFNDIMKLTFYYMSQWKNIIKDIENIYFDEIKNKKMNFYEEIKESKDKEKFNKNNLDKDVGDIETNCISP